MTRDEIRRTVRERSAFLFDLDGTLVDSSPCHERAFVSVLQAYRPDLLPRFDYERQKGKTSEAVFDDLGAGSEAECTRLAVAKRDYYYQEVRGGHIRVFPGAFELLAGLTARGKRLFVVTGGSSRSTANVLELTGLARHFSGAITGDTGTRSKPAPDAFLACLSRFGLTAQESLAIEDAANGVEAARAAGLPCLAVNNPGLTGIPEYAGTLRDLADTVISMEALHD